MNLSHLKIYNKQDILSLTNLRKFETKVGERVGVLSDIAAINQTSARYIIVGIPEDIGIQANYGKPGASTGWVPFLQSFLNIQSNDFFSGEEIALLGHFDFGDLQFLIDKNAQDHEEKVDNFTGIELDLDSIRNTLSSASSPSGLSDIHARQYINLCAAHVRACYLHICEGAVQMPDGRTSVLTGKLISYLVSVFIKMKES